VRRPALALSLALMAALVPMATSTPVHAQNEPKKVLETSSGFNISAVRALLAKGDAAAAAGNLTEARKYYDDARESARRLLTFYRDLSGSFRGLDARIPREMDQNGLESLVVLAQANLRLAAVYRRLNQPEVAVPLLVEVVKTMTPAREEGRKAYQSLVEIGFATIPYNGGLPEPGK
jgi:tetratricopeptide (TPR) repeat protein